MTCLLEFPFLQLFQDPIHKRMCHRIFFVLSINSSRGCILLWIPTIPSLDFFVLWVSEIRHNRMSFLVYLPLMTFILSPPRLFPLPSKKRQNQNDYVVRTRWVTPLKLYLCCRCPFSFESFTGGCFNFLSTLFLFDFRGKTTSTWLRISLGRSRRRCIAWCLKQMWEGWVSQQYCDVLNITQGPKNCMKFKQILAS